MTAVRRWMATSAVIVATALLAACGLFPADDRAAHFPHPLPAIYAGIFPCGDCPEVHYLLQLRADGTYVQRTQFPARPALDDVGRWFVSSDVQRLILFGGKAGRDQFSFEGDGSLMQRVAEGQQLSQPQRYRLRYVPAATPWQPALALTGMYSFANGRARFHECRTGLKMGVIDSAEARRLERGYFDARHNMGEQVMVSLRGGLQPARNGAVQLDVLKFELAMPGASCAAAPEQVPLATTRWELVELANQPVAAVGGGPAPHLQFGPDGTITGSTGCDELDGHYRRRGDQLTVVELQASAAACPGDTVLQMMLTETLRQVQAWRTLGPLLELRDGVGRVVVRLEAAVD